MLWVIAICIQCCIVNLRRSLVLNDYVMLSAKWANSIMWTSNYLSSLRPFYPASNLRTINMLLRKII